MLRSHVAVPTRLETRALPPGESQIHTPTGRMISSWVAEKQERPHTVGASLLAMFRPGTPPHLEMVGWPVGSLLRWRASTHTPQSEGLKVLESSASRLCIPDPQPACTGQGKPEAGTATPKGMGTSASRVRLTLGRSLCIAADGGLKPPTAYFQHTRRYARRTSGFAPLSGDGPTMHDVGA